VRVSWITTANRQEKLKVRPSESYLYIAFDCSAERCVFVVFFCILFFARGAHSWITHSIKRGRNQRTRHVYFLSNRFLLTCAHNSLPPSCLTTHTLCLMFYAFWLRGPQHRPLSWRHFHSKTKLHANWVTTIFVHLPWEEPQHLAKCARQHINYTIVIISQRINKKRTMQMQKSCQDEEKNKQDAHGVKQSTGVCLLGFKISFFCNNLCSKFSRV
jgi:hypothetical protein